MSKLTGMTAKIWLTLLKDGGRYTVAEAAALVEEDVDTARDLLHSMALGGSVRNFGVVGRPKYGVTMACSIARGVTIGDVLKYMAAEETPA